MQRGQARRAETSAAAEVEGVDGDEGTVDGISLFRIHGNQIQEYPKANPKRAEAGDHNTTVCKRAEESLEAGVLTGRRQYEN